MDWSEPTLRVQLAAGTLGEVKREGLAFTAEVRGVTQRLAEESGRLFAARCAADLGDARCKVDLTSAAFKGSGSVTALTGTSSFTASGLDGFAEGWFAAGKLTFTSGANVGLGMEVKSHGVDASVTLALWQAMAQPIAVGDAFTVTAGCDKRLRPAEAASATRRTSAAFRIFPATISSSAIRCRASRVTTAAA